MAGDALIQTIAKKFISYFRSEDIIGRVGGDEFVVFLTNVKSASEVVERARKLCDLIKTIRIEGTTGNDIPACSVGVGMYPQHGNTYSSIFNAADTALYFIKEHGKDGVKLAPGA